MINLDTDITGTFDNGGIESDSYRFTLSERQYLYFDGQIGNYDNAWILYNSNGQYITSKTFYQNQGYTPYNDSELWLNPGDYWLILQGNGAESWTNGSNDYKLQIVTPELITTPYTLGTTITNRISEQGEQDYYTFEGTAGQRLFLDALINNNDTYASLTAPSGKSLFSSQRIRDNRSNIILDESGTYRLTIDASGDITENYGFRLLEYGSVYSHAQSQASTITLNTEIVGSFDDPQQRESDFYRFTNLAANQSLYIDTLNGEYPNGWTIFRSNGDLLISGYLYEDKEISLPDVDEYTLEVWGGGSGNKNYKLKLITPELNTIAYNLGETITSAISQKGEQDTYTFTGTAGQWLYLDILNGNSNLKAKLYSPTGVLEVDDDTNGDWTPTLLREAGTYRLVIDGVGESTGNYSFAFRNQATAIALSTTLSEQLNQGNETKIYQINGQAGQVLNFNYLGQILTPKIDSATGHAYVLTDLAGTWTEARVMAQAMGGNLVSINSAIENQFLVNQIGSSQPFWIGLSDAAVEGNWQWVNGDPYNYTNWLSGQPDNAGNIEDYGSLNWGSAGHWNDLPNNYSNYRGIVENDGTTPLRSQLWQGANWVLYDPSGQAIATPSTNSPDFKVSLAASGRYTLAVVGSSNTPVNYEFQVTDITPNRVTNSGLNSLHSGNLSAGQVVDYNFNANVGTLVYFDSQDDSNWQIRYRLLNPDGSFVFSDHDGRYDRTPFVLSQTGQYKLQVFGYYSDTTGNYKFNLLELPKSLGSPAASYLEQGSTISGNLNNGETKIYTFEGLQNLKVMLNMMTANGVTVSLYNPNGTQVFSGNYDSYYQWYDNGIYSLSQNGQYYLTLSAATGASRNYSFQFLSATEAPEIAYGISQKGTLTPGQASTFYSLNAEAGDRLFFDIQSTNAPNGNYRWILYGPGNNVVFNQELRYNGEVTLSAGGQYYLYLQGGPDATPINYQFRIFNLDQPTRDILTPGSGQQASNTADALGLFNVRLGVKDGQGGIATQDYQIRLWPDPENGNPAIISQPETRFALDSKAYRYQLQSIDPDNDPLVYRLLDSPTGAFINGETGELLWFPDTTVKSGDKATFTVEVNDRRGGFNQQTFTVDVFSGLGTIRGGVFDDLNGNGLRDTKLIQGDDPALIFTIDVSGSTAAPFRGKGEYENIQTVVDAQVAAAEVLLNAIIAQGAGDRVKVGLILFGSDALIQDLDPTTPGLQQYTTAIADADHNGVRDFEQILKTLKPGMIPGGTDIHTALDKIDALFDVLQGDPNFIFMSDGYDSEFDKARAKVTVDDLNAKGGNITAFAIGEAATTATLKAIDPDAIQVVDFDELYNIFFGFDDRYAIEPWKEGVTVYLDLNNNQVLDPDEPFRVTKEDKTINTLGNSKYYYIFDNLIPGSYTLRVEVPKGSKLTAPPANQLPIIDTVTVQGETFNHLFGVSKVTEPPNENPIFLSTPPKNLQLKAGQLLKYDADARDANGDPLTYKLTFAPEGMTIAPESGIVVWLPTQQQVEQSYQDLRQINEAAIVRGRLDLVQPYPLFNVLVTVKDGRGGTALQYLKVELLSDNHLPVFTSIVPENGQTQVGKTFRYQATAQDPDGDTLTYSLINGAPIGASINAQTGLVTWTPTNSQLGARELTLKVADGKGGETMQTLLLGVNSATPNQSPVITSNPRTTSRTGDTYFYQIQASDPDGDLLSYSLPTAPTGMMVSTVGLMTWETTAAQSGAHNITLRVSDGQLFTEQSFTLNLTYRAGNNTPLIISAPNTVTNLEQTYTYNLKGQDADGDRLFWSLDQAPDGMVIDIQTGALRWLPQSNQLGQHSIVVKLLDSFGAFSTQTYILTVNGTNTPAKIISTPPTKAAINQPYRYTLTATDPENSPFTYSLGRRPSSMTIDKTGKIQWIPTQTGNYDIEAIVTDAQGATTTQTYQLVVGSQTINQAPTITSTPGFVADVGNPYQYALQASDPEGQPITYKLLDAPQGMAIDANTGLVQWTTPITGNYNIVVAAFDPEGLGVTQGYTLTAKINSLPVIRSTTPPSGAIPGVPYRYDIQASDPDGGALTYSLDADSQGKGITVDERGRLSWTPSVSQAGTHVITLSITDAAGGKVTQSFNLTVAPDTTAPKVVINRSQNFTNKGESVSFQVSATDNVGIANLQLLINNTPVVVDSNGVAVFTPTNPGVITANAIAIDVAGNKGEATTTVNVLDPTDSEAPSVALDLSGITKGTITSPTEIKGTVNDSTLQYYTLEIAPADGSAPFKEMFRGTQAVTNGVLGKFDPSLLSNDTYTLRLTAYDAGGHLSSIEDTVSIAGGLKLGNFQLSFTDLEIPVSGIPITLIRTYDTLNANTKDDFGYGWRMEFRDADVHTSVGKDDFYEDIGIRDTGFYSDRTKVYITLPGGKREGFTFQLKEYNSRINAYLRTAAAGSGISEDPSFYIPSFIPDAGVTSTLTVPTGGIILLRGNDDRAIPFAGGSAYRFYNPVDWGNSYTLTTKEGVVYNIDATNGDINSIIDANNNKLSFTDGGVISSSGQNITFERDAKGQITAVIDPLGNKIQYQYDSQGDLVAVTDRENNKTLFLYDDTQSHYLDQIIDPFGRTGVKNEYDAQGRLKKIIDTFGNPVELTFDPDQFIQTIKNELGNTTTFVYDDRGNTIKQIDAIGGVINRTFDDKNNILAQTTPGGQIYSYAYDNNNNLTSVTDPLGSTTRYTFNRFGEILTKTNPLGSVTTYAYDDRGNQLSITIPEGTIIKYAFNFAGQPTAITDGNGNTTQFAYDLSGNLVKEIDALGHETTYTYDKNSNLQSKTQTVTLSTGAKTLVTQWSYDANNNVTAITNPDGTVIHQEYNQLGKLAALIDPLNRRTEYHYDEAGRLIETLYADGTSEQSIYDAAGQEIATIDQAGQKTQFKYDPNGRLTAIIYPDLTPSDITDNPTTLTEYDKNGQVTARIDQGGNRTEYKYDLARRLIEMKDALGKITTYTYDAAGNKLTTNDPLGRTTNYSYDSINRPINTQFADGSTISHTFDILGRRIASTNQNGQTTHSEYDALGRLIAVIDSLGNRTTYQYDELGRVVRETDGNNHATTYEYDVLGRKTSQLDALGNKTSFTYDAVGNQLSQIDGNNHQTQFVYDVLNKLVETKFADNTILKSSYDVLGRKIIETDQQGKTTQYEYDPQGNLTAVIDALNQKTTYSYDKFGNLIAQTDANNNSTSYEYDALNRRVASTLPLGQRATTNYDTVGNILSKTDFNNHTINYQYDTVNQLVKEQLSDGTFITYTHTPTGKLATTKDAFGTTTYTYDGKDRLLSLTNPDNQQIAYSYDGVDNRTSITTPTGTTTYSYDGTNRLSTVTDPNQQLTRYSYDKVGNLVKTELPNSVTEIRAYDPLNRLTYLENKNTNGVISSYQYTLDGTGYRLKVLENSDRQVEYTYDDLHRLTQQLITDAVSGNRTIEYTYDPVGNRLSSDDSAAGLTTYIYDKNDRLQTETINGQGIAYTYDANGNILSRFKNATDNTIYTWDDRNHLISANITDTTGTRHSEYRYNPEGIRIAANLDGQETRYLIDPNQSQAQVLAEYQPNGTVQSTYTYGLDLISQNQSGNYSFYLVDGLGSTRILTNAIGNITDTYNYEAFGNLISSTGNTINNYRYAGEQYDSNLSQYYLRARYYDPSEGRFTARDPFAGFLTQPLSLAKYSYTYNNPVNLTDPSGMYVCLAEESNVLAIQAELIATEATAIATTTSLGTTGVITTEAIAADAALVNVAAAPISITQRIVITVAKVILTAVVIEVAIENLNLGIPIILWGSELPETTKHTYEAITGISGDFKDGTGIASPFLGRVSGWGRGWLDGVLPIKTGQVRDEYPYNSSVPGGPIFYDLHQVSVRYVVAYEQTGSNPITGARGQGTKLGSFYSRADVVAYVPLHMWFGVGVTSLPSFYITRDGRANTFPFL